VVSVDGTRSPRYATAVPAPLGKVPTKKMPQIQVFGRDDSPATRAALRFFRERRIVVHYVDLKKRPIAPTELRRFTDRLGAHALLDDGSKAFRDAGLGYLSMGDGEIAERLARDSRLIRLPLVRHANDVTAGPAETTWVAWLTPGSGATATR
jgi:arsenate reductase